MKPHEKSPRTQTWPFDTSHPKGISPDSSTVYYLRNSKVQHCSNEVGEPSRQAAPAAQNYQSGPLLFGPQQQNT